jgi:hypothetical protein
MADSRGGRPGVRFMRFPGPRGPEPGAAGTGGQGRRLIRPPDPASGGAGGATPGDTGHLDRLGASGADGAVMPRGQGAGRKKLALCQAAAEGGSRGQLVSGERLDRGRGRTSLDSRNEVRNDPKTVPEDPWRRMHKAVGGPAGHACSSSSPHGAAFWCSNRCSWAGVERLHLNRNGYQIRCRWPPGGRSRSPGGWPGRGGLVAVVAARRRGNGARAHRRRSLDHR